MCLFSDPVASFVPTFRRDRWERLHMTVLSAIRHRFSGPATSVEPKSTGDPQAGPASEADGRPPFAGYDRLDKRQVMDGFSDHSQIELEAAESYERANKGREPVLDKLRYMRGRE